MTKKIVTNEDLIKLLSKERQKRIKQEVEEIIKTHGDFNKNINNK